MQILVLLKHRVDAQDSDSKTFTETVVGLCLVSSTIHNIFEPLILHLTPAIIDPELHSWVSLSSNREKSLHVFSETAVPPDSWLRWRSFLFVYPKRRFQIWDSVDEQ